MTRAAAAACDDLAVAGEASGAPSLLLTSSALQLVPLAVLACLLVLGGVVLVWSHSRRRTAAGIGALVLVLVVAVMLGTTPEPPAEASAVPCQTPGTDPESPLTIAQMTTVDELAPGVAPTPITGSVVNDSPERTLVTAIVVSIVSVTKAEGAAAGTCDSSDYVLLDPRMPVDQTLEPGASATFSGASIGFHETALNQDACKGATVHLRYVTE